MLKYRCDRGESPDLFIMSMEDYIISQVFLKIEMISGLLEQKNYLEAQNEIEKIKLELNNYQQDRKKGKNV